MTPKQTLVIAAVTAFFIVLVLELIRRQRLRERYSMLWFFIALAALTVPLLYGAYAWAARMLGFVEVNNLFVFLAVLALLLLSLQFSIAISTAYQRAKTLVQQIGLLERRVRELEEQLAARGPQPPSPDAGGK